MINATIVSKEKGVSCLIVCLWDGEGKKSLKQPLEAGLIIDRYRYTAWVIKFFGENTIYIFYRKARVLFFVILRVYS